MNMSIQINSSNVFKTPSALYLSFARGRVTDIFSFQMPLQQHNTAAGNMLSTSYRLSAAASDHGHPTFFCQRDIPVIAGWFVSHTWKKNGSGTPNRLYQFPIFIV